MEHRLVEGIIGFIEHHHPLVAQRRHLFLRALPMRTRCDRHRRIAPLDRRVISAACGEATMGMCRGTSALRACMS